MESVKEGIEEKKNVVKKIDKNFDVSTPIL